MDSHVVDGIISEFEKLTETPEIFIKPQLEIADRFLELARQVYEYAVASNRLTNIKAKSLKKLLIKGFDEEQIWQQIEVQNDAVLPFFLKTVPSINLKEVLLAIHGSKLNSKEVTNNILKLPISQNSNESDIEENYAFDDDSDSSTDMVEAIKKKTVAHDDDDDSDSSTDMVEAIKKKTVAHDDDNDSSSSAETYHALKNKVVSSDDDLNLSAKPSKSRTNKSLRKESTYTSKVDDRFFKLSKLDQFLRIEDLKESKEDGTISDDDDGINLFEDILSDSMDELNEQSDEEVKTKKSSKNVMYEDFFDAPESEDEHIGSLEDMNIYEKNDLSLEDASGEDMKDDVFGMKTNEGEEKTAHSSSTQKTAFELEQEKIRMQIQEHEKSILEPMSWQLTGEVAASSRPIDSLIHQETEFDSNVKQDNATTGDKINERIETIVKMAIINKAYDDVVRKVKPTEDVIAYKKREALDQTKSKKGLAEVYEEDYLKKKAKQEEEVNPKHEEIKKLGDSIFADLHALFSNIPKPAVPEIKIISNMPTIIAEEVAPTSVSDVTLLAPEEVKKKSGLVKGMSERTDTDRKRERRKKKIHQRLKEKKNQEKLKSQKPNSSGKTSKLQKQVTLKKIKQNKNTEIANVDVGDKIKSSKDFFTKLQEVVNINTKIQSKKLHTKRKNI